MSPRPCLPAPNGLLALSALVALLALGCSDGGLLDGVGTDAGGGAGSDAGGGVEDGAGGGADSSGGGGGGGGGEACGDKTCSDDESPVSCPADCAPTAMSCAQEACGEAWQTCAGNLGCALGIVCTGDCDEDDNDCVRGCKPSGGDDEADFQALLSCARANDCIEGGGGGGGGGNDACGDGTCSADEDIETCVFDCADAPWFGCLEGQCGDFWFGCAEDAQCAEGFFCILQCQSQQCANGCLQSGAPGPWQELIVGLLQCGDESGCFGGGGGGGGGGGPQCGDGQCEQGESGLTCPEDCSPESCGNGTCDPGEDLSNCTEDCIEQTCGNGTCQFPAETGGNCPQDCQQAGEGLIGECLGQFCGQAWGICGQVQPCFQTMVCLAECQTTSCVQDCVPPGGQQWKQALGASIQCGQQNQCFNVAGDGPNPCGNGICDAGESAETCPEDCPASGPICGDGVCSEGEAEVCPDDCGPKTCAGAADCADGQVCCANAAGELFCVEPGDC